MLKYVDAVVTFAEVPDEINLCVSISGCPNHCPECHSKYLWENIGEELNEYIVSRLIIENRGITCVCFMGGDSNPEEVSRLARIVKNDFGLKTCWYSGRTIDMLNDKSLLEDVYKSYDYVKFGPYDGKYGPLNKKTTNQRFYKIIHQNGTSVELEDWTYRFWKK